MNATSISVSKTTRKLLESLKTGGETYDDVIRALIVSHPNRLAMAEYSRRIGEGQRHSVEALIRKSRRQPY
jgi:predicted CopG family antitoxin